MNKIKKSIYFMIFFSTLNLSCGFSEDVSFLKESREFPSEDSVWFVTAVSLELFPQDDNVNQEQTSPKIDSSLDEPNFSDD